MDMCHPTIGHSRHPVPTLPLPQLNKLGACAYYSPWQGFLESIILIVRGQDFVLPFWVMLSMCYSSLYNSCWYAIKMWHSVDYCLSQQWRECNWGVSIGLKMSQNTEAQNCIQHWAYLGYAGSYTREIDVSNHPLMYRLKAENRELRIAVSGENIRVRMIHTGDNY